MATERYSLQDADELDMRQPMPPSRSQAPRLRPDPARMSQHGLAGNARLQFPGGAVSLPKPTRTALTVTARSWLRLALATGANAERLLDAGDDVRESVADLESMARNIRMALAALGERK